MNNNHSGDRYLRSLGLRPAQDSDALAAQLRQAVGDAQAEAACPPSIPAAPNRRPPQAA